MQRKPGFPVANCSIKMPENMNSIAPESFHCDDDLEQQQRRQQLINFGHAQWGFNNWSWTVTKQELDFVDLANGKYTAGVVAFVSVTVKSFDIHRENIGYATSIAGNKGFAIYKSRKCAVTNALRETLLSFGGSVATELMELLEAHKPDVPAPLPAGPGPVAAAPEPANENNQNLPNKMEPRNSPVTRNLRKDADPAANMRAVLKPPVAAALPMPAPRVPAPPAPRVPAPPRVPVAPVAAVAPPPPQLRPNSNEPVDADEEARAERKRRQRQAQEEFRQRQLMKQKGSENPDATELNRNATLDQLMVDLPSQEVVIEDTGDSNKRRSPAPEAGQAKRRASVINRLDIVEAD